MPSDPSVDNLTNGPSGPQFRVMVYLDNILPSILDTGGKLATLKDLASYQAAISTVSDPNAFGKNEDLKLLKQAADALTAAAAQVNAEHAALLASRQADLAGS